jgi:hypothetical protein
MALYSSYKKSLLAGVVFLAGTAVLAQDSTKPRQVTITSSFKPVLKEAAKINFNAAPAVTDTGRPRLQYTIPNQNLNFAFQPGSLRPLALSADTTNKWGNESYIKAGFGNLRTPFLQAGVSIGNGQTAGLNVYGRHVSSEGKRPFQYYSNSSLDAHAFFQTPKNMEWNARIGGRHEKYSRYGFQPETLDFPADSLNIRFQNWQARVGLRNIGRTEFGISYAPELRVDVFGDQRSNTETSTYVHLPLQKALGDAFAVDVALEANISRFKPFNKETISNNYAMVSPSLLWRTPSLNIRAGLRPAWNNGAFELYPNIMAEISTPDKALAFQAGWVGYLRNSGYRYQTRINPWIWAPEQVFNTQIEERYLGVKGSVGDHLSYNAKAAFNTWRNQPLFTNDTIFGGKSFMVINETRMNVVHFGGEVGYTVGEKFSWINQVSINNFNSLQVADRAWGLLPIELRSSVRLQILKDLYLNTDFYAFDGPWVMGKGGDRKNLKGAMDLSAGLEFKVVKNVKLWAQFNNIFNTEYQRWNQYPVYGFNFLGGVVFSFAQKN